MDRSTILIGCMVGVVLFTIIFLVPPVEYFQDSKELIDETEIIELDTNIEVIRGINGYPTLAETYDIYEFYDSRLITAPRSELSSMSVVELEGLSQRLEFAENVMRSIPEDRLYFSEYIDVVLRNPVSSNEEGEDGSNIFRAGNSFMTETGGIGIIIGQSDETGRVLIAYSEAGGGYNPTYEDNPIFFLYSGTVEKLKNDRQLIASKIEETIIELGKELKERGLLTDKENDEKLVQSIITKTN